MNLKTALMIGVFGWLISVTFAQTGARLVPITPDNVANLTELAPLSRGGFHDLQWSPSGDQWVVITASKAWWYHRRLVEPIALSQGVNLHTALFSPDERWLVTAECDTWFCTNGQVLRFWEIDGERLQAIGELRSSGSYAGVFHFSPDGRWFIHETDMRIDVYETATLGALSPTWQIENREDAVYASFSPDGQHLVIINEISLEQNPQLRVIDLNLRQVLYQFEIETYAEVQFSPDGRYFTQGPIHDDTQQSLRVWRTKDGLEVANFQANALSFDASGEQIAVSKARRVTIYTLPDLQPIDMLSVDYGFYLSNGDLMIADYVDGFALLQSDGTRIPLETHGQTWTKIYRLGISPDGRYLFTIFLDQGQQRAFHWMLWDRSGRLIKTHTVPHSLITIAFDPKDNDYLALEESDERRITLWHLPTLTPQPLFEDVFDPGQVLGFVPDQGWVITVTEHDGSRLWQIEADRLRLARMMRDTQPLAVSVSGWIALADGETLTLRDLKGQAADRVFSVPAPCETVTFSADERYLGCINATHGTHIWSLERDEPILAFSSPGTLEFRDQQALLITHRSAIVFDLTTRRIEHTFPRGDDSPVPLFWPDAFRLWQLTPDQSVINLINREAIATLPAYPAQTYHITDCTQAPWQYPCDPAQLPITETYFFRWGYNSLVTSNLTGDHLLMTLTSEEPIWGETSHLIVFWDLVDGRAITVHAPQLGGVIAARFNQAGDLAFVGYDDYFRGGLMDLAIYDELIDPFTGKVLKRLETGFNSTTAITFSPDDRLLLTYGDTLRVWGVLQ